MEDMLTPLVNRDLKEMILEANNKKTNLEILGHGTKRTIGRINSDATPLSLRRLSEITLYEPSELVLSARAGTPIVEIERALKSYNQQLPFEYLDFSRVFGTEPGWGTIGSIFATNFSGSRRILKGSARDHLLGVNAINGRGEEFKSGGRVMKNVAGYDLAKFMANSWGTLGVMTDVTMKLLPAPVDECTLFMYGLGEDIALEALRAAVATPYEISGAVYLNQEHAHSCLEGVTYVRDKSVTAMRLENTSKSIAYRSERIRDLLSAFGDIYYIDQPESQIFWQNMRQLMFLSEPEDAIWRISTTPRKAYQSARQIKKLVDAKVSYDWAGGLLWVTTRGVSDMGSSDIRRIVAEAGGFATLIRPGAGASSDVSPFHPLDPSHMKLTKGIKDMFDPNGVLNPGRMYDGI
ncbi:MAG: 2-hydroxy-acid oxidase [Rhodomicrobium sp.]|nr:MAG: 2-hydroxy-acid oxidase [Rhodomicrobium sp.]